MPGIILGVPAQHPSDSIDVEHQLPRWTDSQVDHRLDVKITGVGRRKTSKGSDQAALPSLNGCPGVMPNQRHDRLRSTSALQEPGPHRGHATPSRPGRASTQCRAPRRPSRRPDSQPRKARRALWRRTQLRQVRPPIAHTGDVLPRQLETLPGDAPGVATRHPGTGWPVAHDTSAAHGGRRGHPVLPLTARSCRSACSRNPDPKVAGLRAVRGVEGCGIPGPRSQESHCAQLGSAT